MTWLLILAGVLLVVWYATRKRFPSSLRWLLGGGLALLAVLLVILRFSSSPQESKVRQLRNLYEQAGERLGEAVARSRPDGGKVLVLTYSHPDPLMREAASDEVRD